LEGVGAVSTGIAGWIKDDNGQFSCTGTMHDNLNQWFDDAKADLLSTGLLDDKRVVDENGAVGGYIQTRCE
jgi:hypothetical protein